MSGQEWALLIGAFGGAVGSILGGVAALQAPIKSKLREMDKAREDAKNEAAKTEEANAQVHRTLVCGQIAIIKALRVIDPKINGKVAEFERKYEHMLEFDCPPPK